MGFRIAAADLVKLLSAEAVDTSLPIVVAESRESRLTTSDTANSHQLGNRWVSRVLFDTRQINLTDKAVGETLFLALKDKRDGHDFVESAYQLGIKQFLVKDFRSEWQRFEDCVFYAVSDVLMALQQLAVWYRSTLTMPVVGITGSNGKTVVKEWLFEVFKDDFGGVYRSPRSFNSQLGVAISILEIPKDCGLAIIEAGISAPGEMRALQQMIKPNLVVFTHLGDAHGAGFLNDQEKAQEKLILAEGADVLIFPFDSSPVKISAADLKKRFPLMKTMTWGLEEGASFRLLPFETGDHTIRFVHRATTHTIPLSQTDLASRENTMSVLLALAAFERWDDSHISAIAQLPRLKNRLSMLHGKRGNVVLNDTYSADMESLAVALEFLHQQSPHQEKVAILADFDQITSDRSSWVHRVKALLDRYKIHRLYLIGPVFSEQQPLFGDKQILVFSNTEALLASNQLEVLSNTGILVKGAHRFGLDRVVDLLQEKHHGTYLEIDLSAIAHNYKYYRSLLFAGTKIMCMVKAFGYGSGTYEAAKRLDSLGVDYLGVAYVDEGISLRSAGVKSPIMVMNVDSSHWRLLVENDLEPVIYSTELFSDLMNFVYSSNEGQTHCSISAPMKIHLELDTGMHRLGFNPGEAVTKLNEIIDSRVEIASVFSHLSASEDSNCDNFTLQQIEQFNGEVEAIERKLGYKVLKHIDNSAGISRFPQAHFSMVRLGIGLYGIDGSGACEGKLIPVNRLVTEVSQVRKVKAGDGIGYGMHDISDSDRIIAVIKMGYADGLLRADGKGVGMVWISGRRAPIVGNVCMDMAMVDVTGIAHCEAGVEVEVFGRNITVEEVAIRRNTIPYEVLTSVSQRVARVFIEG